MTRKGAAFNRLVEKIEKVVGNNKHINIQTNVMVEDKVAHNLREHDILLTYDDGHRKFTVSIECKDWKRKIDQPVVEAFSTKIVNTGIDKGILVSSNGFSKNAISTAKAANINCWSLKKAEQFNWCVTQGITQHISILKKAYLQVVPLEETQKPWRIFQKQPSGHDIEITRDINQYVFFVFNSVEKASTEAGETLSLKIIITDHDDYYLLDENDNKIKISEMTLYVNYTTKIKHLPFIFHEYFDEESGEVKEQIAYANIKVGPNTTGDLVINYGKDGGRISFIPD